MTISDLILNSGMKKGYVADKLGVSMPTFYTKLKNNDFDSNDIYILRDLFRLTDDEVLQLFESINKVEN